MKKTTSIMLAPIIALGIGYNSLFPKVSYAKDNPKEKARYNDATPIYTKEEMRGIKLSDGITPSNKVHSLNLDANSKIDFSPLLYGGKAKVINPRIITKGKKRYLRKNEESKYTWKRIPFIMNEYSDVENLVANQRLNKKSLENLTLALKDGIIDVKKDKLYSNGKWKVQDGIYAVDVNGKYSNGKGWNIPVFVKVTTKKQEPKKSLVKKEKSWGLIGQYRKGLDEDRNGFSIGAQYNHLNVLGVGILADFDKYADKKVSSKHTPEFNGVSGEVNQFQTDHFSVGTSAEIKVGMPLSKNFALHLIGGAGIEYQHYIDKIEGKISDQDSVLKTNTNSFSRSDLYGKVHAGIETTIANKIGLRITGEQKLTNEKDRSLNFGIVYKFDSPKNKVRKNQHR